MSLAEMQRALRRAVVDRDGEGVTALLGGTPHVAGRLAIHQRHYEASLASALLTRHPATTWLVGSQALTDAARAFVREHPPQAPCIAEYGQGFGPWLAAAGLASRVPYIAAFAELDWHLGRVSVEVESPALPVSHLSTIDPAGVAGVTFGLQPGLHYLEADWPIDELMRLFLTDSAPDRLRLAPGAIAIEVRGARGSFRFARIGADDLRFRRALQHGDSLAAAIEAARLVEPTFDPGPAVGRTFAAGLVVSVRPAAEELHS